MTHELLTPEEMANADRLAIAAGPFDGFRLMQNAGAAVAAEIFQRFPAATPAQVLCGPGNNGGDGYVVAELLRRVGAPVELFADARPAAGTDAARAAAEWGQRVRPFAEFTPMRGSLVVDALFGAGLTRALGETEARLAELTRGSGAVIIAIDLPSGVSGRSGHDLGHAFRADLTVTFFRKKPGHLLHPGKALCGEVVLADIGIPESVLAEIRPAAVENHPSLWLPAFPTPSATAHKYRRGHVGVFSGGPAATGAARLAAMAAARIGAGAVTVLAEANAVAVNTHHLTSIMVRRVDGIEEVAAFIADRKPRALVYGPGLGRRPKVARFALDLLLAAAGHVGDIVLDADGLSAFEGSAKLLFEAAARDGAPRLTLTPHDAEFARLFPDLAADASLSKLDRTRVAAARARATVVLKGDDTVIAAADGRAAINSNGTPWLATAGSGDVLSGILAGLLAQGMPGFEAALAAVHIHAAAAAGFGPGLIAEDLPGLLPGVLRRLTGWRPEEGSAS